MSFGKSKSKQASSQQQSTDLTAASQARWQSGVDGILGSNAAIQAAPTPVAGLSQTEQQARQLAQGSVGNWQGILGDATGAAQAGVNYDPSNVSKYYNPFEQNVVDSISGLYDEELARQINQQNDAVAQRGAFGNVSRDFGEAEIRRGGALDKTNAIAQLKYGGYKDAVDTGFRDAANKYQGAGILGSLAGQKQQLSTNDVQMLSQLGATEREIEQAKLTGDFNKLLLDLQVRQGILGATPITTGSTGSSTGSSSSTNFGASVGFSPTTGFSLGG